ncbi:IclR family transcriptional regulator [Gluconobacter kanchanaburiensis NBRC 103587]|nr:IclR family transcriptional regulator [Gluconobacter kanchanaburiensis NBRC 103587]
MGYIAKRTDLPRSTVQRLVNALAAEELVEVTNDGVSLSWGIMRLAEAAQSSLLDKFRSAIETMFQETHETVDFSTVYGKEVTFIEKIHSDQEIRVVPKSGRPMPLHAMSNGKAMLSMMSKSEIQSLLGSQPLKMTPHTKTNVKDILNEIETVKATGYAYDFEEHSEGVCCIASPIVIPGHRPYAISITVPFFRFKKNIPLFQESLNRCKNKIELF